MQQLTAILRLYGLQFVAHFHTPRPRAQMLGSIIMLFVLGCLMTGRVLEQAYPHGNARLDYAALAGLILWWCKVQLSVNLMILPQVLFSPSQMEEMADCRRFPAATRRLALMKYLDLATMLVIWNLFMQLPMVLALFANAYSPGELLQFLVMLGAYALVLHLCLCLALGWAALGCGLVQLLPRQKLRPLLIIIAWNGLPVLISLFLIVPELADAAAFETLERPVRALFQIMFGPAFGMNLATLGVLLGLSGFAFRLTQKLVARFYVEPIFLLQDRLFNRFDRAAPAPVQIGLPLLPRPIQALCRKDLRLTVRSYAFWLFLALGFVPTLVVMLVNFAGQDGNTLGGEQLGSGMRTALVFPVVFFLLHVGLWTYRYEGENNCHLLVYPVPPTVVTLGKGLAVFLLVLPAMGLMAALEASWLTTAPVEKMVFVTAYLFFLSVAATVIGGATLNYTGRNVLEAITWTGRLVLIVVLAVSQTGFWLVMSVADYLPLALLGGTAVWLALAWFAASLTARLVPGFHAGHQRAAALEGERTREPAASTTGGPPVGGSLHNGGRAARRTSKPTAGGTALPGRLGATLKVAVLAGLLSLPVFASLFYVLGGYRGYLDLPRVWQLGVALLPVLLGVACFLPQLSRSWRLCLYLGVLVLLPLGAVQTMGRDCMLQRGRGLRLVPARLAMLVDAVGRSRYDSYATERRAEWTPKPLPAALTAAFGYPAEWTLSDLVAQGTPPAPGSLRRFLDAWNPNTLAASATSAGLAAWLGDSVSAQDFRALLAWRLPNSRDQIHGSALDWGVVQPLLLGAAPRLAPDEVYEPLLLLLTTEPEGGIWWTIAAEFDWSGLDAEQQATVRGLLACWLGSRPAVSTNRQDWWFKPSGKAVDQAQMPLRFRNWLRQEHLRPLLFLSRVPGGASFDCAQAHLLRLLPSRQKLLPPDADLVAGTDRVTHEQLATLAENCPAYAVFLLLQHPQFAGTPEALAAAALRLAQTSHANASLTRTVLSLTPDPLPGMLLLDTLGWEEFVRLFYGTAKAKDEHTATEVSPFGNYFGDDSAGREPGLDLVRWLGYQPAAALELLRPSALPPGMAAAALSEMCQRTPSPRAFWEYLIPHVLERPHDPVLTHTAWQALLTRLPAEEQMPAVMLLLRSQVPLENCVPPTWYPQPGSVDATPRATVFVRELLRAPETFIVSNYAASAYYHHLGSTGEKALAREWLRRYRGSLPGSEWAVRVLNHEPVSRTELFDQLRLVSGSTHMWVVEALRLLSRGPEEELLALALGLRSDRSSYYYTEYRKALASIDPYRLLIAWPLGFTLLFWLAATGTGVLTLYRPRWLGRTPGLEGERTREPLPPGDRAAYAARRADGPQPRSEGSEPPGDRAAYAARRADGPQPRSESPEPPGDRAAYWEAEDKLRREREAVARLPGLGRGFALMLLAVALQLCAGLFFLTAKLEATDPIVLTVVNVVSLGLPLWLGVKTAGLTWAEALPLRPFSARLLPPLLLVVLGAGILASECDNVLRTWLPPPDEILQIFKDLGAQGWRSLVVLLLCAPLTEETFFRGLLLRSFVPRYGARKAIVFTALLFAVIHLNPYQFMPALGVGIFLGWLLLRSGSLWPCIVAHALFNSQTLLVEFLPFEVPGYNLPGTGSQFQPLWFNALALLFIGGGVWGLWRLTRDGNVHAFRRDA